MTTIGVPCGSVVVGKLESLMCVNELKGAKSFEDTDPTTPDFGIRNYMLENINFIHGETALWCA